MATDEQDVVLTLPASPEFGDVARRAVGELAKRRGFTPPEWEELEAAVSRVLTVLGGRRGDRVRLRFETDPVAILVDAQLDHHDASPAPALDGGAIDDFQASLGGLVEVAEIDPGAGRIRIRKQRNLAE